MENLEKGMNLWKPFRRSKTEKPSMRTPDEIDHYYGLLNDEYKGSKDFRTLIKIRELAQVMRLPDNEKATTTTARLANLRQLYTIDRDFRTRLKIQVCEFVLGI